MAWNAGLGHAVNHLQRPWTANHLCHLPTMPQLVLRQLLAVQIASEQALHLAAGSTWVKAATGDQSHLPGPEPQTLHCQP